MKRIYAITIAIVFTIQSFAQCDPATIRDMPTVYTREYSPSWRTTPEQDKYMTAVFTSIIEPALKSTKGLKGSWEGLHGDWEFMGGFNATPDVLTSCTIVMYMSVMGCTKDKKIYEKSESGLVINFDLNSLHFISKMSEVETYRNNNKVYIPNKIGGAQIYQLKQSSQSDKYSSLPFYRQTDKAKYFLVAKNESPFFIPVTIREALELSISNMTAEIAETNKQNTSTAILSKEAWIKKEGLQPVAGVITAKVAQEHNDAGYEGYVEGSEGLVKGINFQLESYKKSIGIVKDVLKTVSADALAKPATDIFLQNFFADIAELKQLVEKPRGEFLVIVNNVYLKTNLPKAAPRFIGIELRGQTNDPVTQKAFINFEEALDFKKLQSLL